MFSHESQIMIYLLMINNDFEILIPSAGAVYSQGFTPLSINLAWFVCHWASSKRIFDSRENIASRENNKQPKEREEEDWND